MTDPVQSTATVVIPKLDREHLHFLLVLETGVKTEFFGMLSATKKKLALDLAAAHLIIINEENKVLLATRVKPIIAHVEAEFHKAASAFKAFFDGPASVGIDPADAKIATPSNTLVDVPTAPSVPTVLPGASDGQTK